jgi:hypothetical protein
VKVDHPPGRVPVPGPGYHPGIDSGEGDLDRSWLRRHGAAIFLALLLVFGGVVVLVEVGPKGLLGFSPQSRPTVVNPRQGEFEGVMHRIYDVANQAVRERRADLLGQAYADTCQCAAQVKATIDRLLATHETLGGAGMQVTAVEVELARTDTAILRVTDKIDPYPEYAESGALITTVPGRGPLQFTVTLEQRNGAWLMTDAVPAANALP